MFLKSIKIKNYKSLKDIEIDNLSALNAFIGPNMAGKSNVIDAFLFLIEGTKENFAEALNRRGGFKSISYMQKVNQNIEIELIFEIDTPLRNKFLDKYIKNGFKSGTPEERIFNSDFLKKLRYKLSFKLTDLDTSIFQEGLYTPNIMDGKTEFSIVKQFKTKGGPSKSIWGLATEKTPLQEQINSIKQDKGPWNQNNPNFKLLFSNFQNINNTLEDKIISSFVDYIRNIKWLSPYKNIQNIVKIGGENNLLPDASNLTDVLHYLKNNRTAKFEEFTKQVSSIVPEVKEITTPVNKESSSTISIREVEEIFHSLQNLSSGMKSVLSIITILTISYDKNLILIEEPENHLHPSAIRKLNEILKYYSLNRQIILTTHSPILIGDFNIFSTHLLTKNEGQTRIEKITGKNIHKVVSELGIKPSDILEHNKIVFLEGESDKFIWKVFEKKLKRKVKDIRFISTDGWLNIRNFATIDYIKELIVKPTIFVIWDGDLITKEETKEPMKKMIELLKKDCNIKEKNIITLPEGEIECYLLDVKAWFKTWPELKRKKITKEKLEEKFNIIRKSTRQKEEFRNLITELQLGKYTKEKIIELAENIDKIPKDIEKIFEKIYEKKES